MGATGKLVVKQVAVTKVSDELLVRMYRIFAKYYEDVHYSQFCADLKDKDHVFLGYDRNTGDLQGFSTIKVYEALIGRKKVNVLFSGDTIVEKAYWGQTALHKALFKYVVTLKLKFPFRSLYWFLISKGYKTYLALARNVPDHWPNYQQPTPEFEARLLDRLASDKYPDSWRPELGVLKFKSCMGRLREGVACVDNRVMALPEVQFFQSRNPDHMAGDELCCLGKINGRLVWFFSQKLARKSLGRFFGQRRAKVVEALANVEALPVKRETAKERLAT